MSSAPAGGAPRPKSEITPFSATIQPALDHLVGEHQAGIGEGEGARRCGHGFYKIPCKSRMI